MKPKTYIETSVISYLTALPSRDLVIAAQQQMTMDWWASREAFDLFVSEFVLEEAGRGDVAAAGRRLGGLGGLPLLEVTAEAITLAEVLVSRGGLPTKARVDAFHVAIATVHGMDFLLTWNCKHIANATLRGTINHICRDEGYQAPVICTPMELAQE